MTFRDTTEYSSTKVRTIKNQNKFRAHEPRTVKNNVVKNNHFISHKNNVKT